MTKPYSITQARLESERTPKNDFIDYLNGRIQVSAKKFENEVDVEIYNMNTKLYDIAKINFPSQLFLKGKPAELLLSKDQQDALAEFRKEGYKIVCLANGDYNNAAYEEGWEFKYTINIKW